jgi:predicted cupin superfamily sugar epimerase
MLPTKRSELIHGLGLVPHPEGGYFLETHRSGSTPMSSRGLTDKNVDKKALVQTWSGEPRNALTSIYWIPTLQSPKLRLVVYESDHVLYYQGGQPFEFWLFDPSTDKLDHCVLGPDICNGQILQLPVRSGVWKCGHMLTNKADQPYEFTMIGEAVGPGFDVKDFSWITIDMLERMCPIHIQKLFEAFVNEKSLSSAKEKIQDFDKYYDEAEDKKDLSLSPSQNRRLFQLNYEPF